MNASLLRHCRIGLVAIIAACGASGSRKDLVVTSFSPAASTDDARAIEIAFDKPVVGADQVGSAADPTTVAVEPAFAWTGHWRDRQTLVIEPSAPLAPSTRYRVALAGELDDRTDGFAFDFVHRPLVVEGIWGVDLQAVPPTGDLPLAFNQPVAASDAAAKCALLIGGERIALAPRDPASTGTTIALTPAKALTPGADYHLACEALAGAGGNAALEAPYSLALRARPTLSVLRVAPGGSDVAADEVTIDVQLSTAVSLDAIRAAMSSKPAIPGLDRGSLDASGMRYRVTADLETETRYTITLRGLVDVHGQALTATYTHELHTGNARPRFSMERGIYALEASAAGYPVWTRNVKDYDIECARIPREKLVQLLTTEMNYDPWGGSEQNDAVDWKSLSVAPRTAPRVIPGARNKWNLDHLDLGATCDAAPRARGVYLAEVRSRHVTPDPDRPWLAPNRNRVLANVTDLGVLIKVGPASGLVWVTSLATGAPVAGARVAVHRPDGTQVHAGVTDAQGLLRTPGSAALKSQTVGPAEGDWDSYRSQRLIAVVEKDADLAVVDGNWANGIQIWNFGVPEDREGGATRIRGFIQSDRGLYRPGETVHFKGLVREIAATAPPRVPRGKAPVTIEVSDSRGATVLSTRAALSPFGGFAFDLPLTAEASLGDYHVVATVAGQTFRERFQVEEFRPAAFEIELASAAARVRPGDRLGFSLDARYLFGAPLPNAEVQWNVRRRAHPLRFAGYDQYSFDARGGDGWWWGYQDEDYGDHVADGTGTTSDRGHLSFAVRDPATKLEGPQDYIVTAQVTDASDQTLGASKVITAHQSDLYLGLFTQEWVQAVGMPFAVNVVAVDPAGKRVATSATLRFVRTRHDCSWSEIGARSYQRCESSEEVALERTIAVPATGTATERIYPRDPGDYRITVETTDARGTRVLAASSLWVIGKGEAFWSGDEAARMTLIASKKSYRAGDKARLVAQANLKNPTALITIERDGVLEAEVRRMNSASEGVELTVKDAWAPNVFASVAMVSGRHGDGDRNRPQIKVGVVELAVSSEHKRLDVAVELDDENVKPGEPVRGRIRVTSGGAPVKAEVSLSAADEGVLQLIAYRTPDPMKSFYATWGLGVDTGTNWNRLARLADPGSGDPDEGGDMGSSSDQQRIRSRFVSSAYWAPALVTDARGEIAFAFTAPDNLTAFRLMAVAADAGDRFGAGEKRLTVAKPLMATAAVPRFLGAGDALSVGVVVHNHTGQAGTATVTARTQGAVLGSSQQRVTVAAGGTARVRFAATASENAAATFDFAVALGSERDALHVQVPIRRPRVTETRTITAGVLRPGATIDAPLAFGAGVLKNESQLVVTVDRTGMAGLEPSLRYLIEYPYGCLEQTLSRFIPLVEAKDLASSLALDSLPAAKMDGFIAAGVAKVVRHQQGDGHFSLWPQSQTYPHLTVYALWGLLEARKAGVAVPQEPLDRGVAALQRWIKDGRAARPDGDGATLAMAAFVLAEQGKADAGLEARLYDLRVGLPRWGQAFLLRALATSKAAPALVSEMRTLLIRGVKVTGDVAFVEDTADWDHMASPTRATAMTLAALLAVAPSDPLVAKLAAGLDADRDASGAWRNTQDNLWSLVALAAYARRTAPGEATITVTAGDQLITRKKLRGAEVHVVRLPLDKVAAGPLHVSADGAAHYAVRVTEVRKDSGQEVQRGFAIERAYLDASGAPITSAKAGDLVTVRLTVTSDAHRRWIAMVDPLPAGLEAVNPRLVTSAGTGSTQAWYWAHHELRDDRVAWFADWMPQGSFVLSYQARATIDGTFAVAPAHVEAMYQPEVMGRTAMTSFVVRK